MAMIKCPECKKEISEKAKECIHCGCPINSNEEEPQKVEVKKVSFGSIISKRNKVIFAISFIVIAVVIIGVIIYKNEARKAAVRNFKTEMMALSDTMLDGGVKAEACAGLIKKVWYNSIWEEDDEETDKFTKKNGKFNEDFNDSLQALYVDDDFLSERVELEDNKDDVIRRMKKMKNPPAEMKEQYEDLKEYYDNYLTLANMCIDPTGSYNSYSEKYSKIDSELADNYKKMQTYFED